MNNADNTHPDQRLRDSKARDRALVLPLAGVLLLISPFAGIFQLDAMVLGVPFTLIYLFTVWAALIAGALLLSRRLRDGEALASNVESPDSIRDDANRRGSGSE